MHIYISNQKDNYGNKIIIAASTFLIIVSTLIHAHLESRSLDNKIDSEMRITAYNLSASLAFNDVDEAKTILDSLQEDHEISGATLRNPNFSIFLKSEYKKNISIWTCNEEDANLFICSHRHTIIKFKNNTLGHLTVTYSKKYIWIQSSLFLILLSTCSFFIWLLISSSQFNLNEKIKSYETTLIKLLQKNNLTNEENNKKVALEIHDQIGQLISNSLMRLDILSTKIPSKNVWEIENLKENLSETYNRVKNISKNLHPVIIKFGLSISIESLAEKTFTGTYLSWKIIDETNDSIIPDHLAIVLYRICQEAFTNILKHAQASHVKINISLKDKALEMVITDNGVGFQKTKRNTDSLGLIGISERAASIGASVNIISNDNGTILEINVPNALS